MMPPAAAAAQNNDHTNHYHHHKPKLTKPKNTSQEPVPSPFTFDDVTSAASGPTYAPNPTNATNAPPPHHRPQPALSRLTLGLTAPPPTTTTAENKHHHHRRHQQQQPYHNATGGHDPAATTAATTAAAAPWQRASHHRAVDRQEQQPRQQQQQPQWHQTHHHHPDTKATDRNSRAPVPPRSFEETTAEPLSVHVDNNNNRQHQVRATTLQNITIPKHSPNFKRTLSSPTARDGNAAAGIERNVTREQAMLYLRSLSQLDPSPSTSGGGTAPAVCSHDGSISTSSAPRDVTLRHLEQQQQQSYQRERPQSHDGRDDNAGLYRRHLGHPVPASADDGIDDDEEEEDGESLASSASATQRKMAVQARSQRTHGRRDRDRVMYVSSTDSHASSSDSFSGTRDVGRRATGLGAAVNNLRVGRGRNVDGPGRSLRHQPRREWSQDHYEPARQTVNSNSGSGTDNSLSTREFLKFAKNLSREDMLSSLGHMFTSLNQFRSLLEESKGMHAYLDDGDIGTYSSIASRICNCVQADGALLFLFDTNKESHSSGQMIGSGGGGGIGNCAKLVCVACVPSAHSHVIQHSIPLNDGISYNRPDGYHFVPPSDARARDFVSHVAVTGLSAHVRDWTALRTLWAREGQNAVGRYVPPFDMELRGKLNHVHIDSVMGVPIKNRHQRGLGAIILFNKQQPPYRKRGGHTSAERGRRVDFSDQDIQIAEFMANMAGHTIENVKMYEGVVTRRVQTETLLQITELMSSEIDSDKVIARVIEASYLLVDATQITLFVLYPRARELVGRIGRSTLRVPLNKGVVGYVATTGKTVRVANARHDWRFDAATDDRPGLIVSSLLCVPVNDHQGKTIAVIEAVNKNTSTSGRSGGTPAPANGVGTFNSEDETLLKTLAASAGVVIRKSQLYEEAVKRRRQTEALLQITELMSAELGAEQVVGKIIMSSYMLVDADRILMYELDETSNALVCKFAVNDHDLGGAAESGVWQRDAGEYAPEVDENGRVIMTHELMIGKGIVGHVALTGRLINVPDASQDWRCDRSFDRKTGYETRSVLAVPIKDFLGKTVAVLEMLNKKVTKSSSRFCAFSVDDETVMKSLSFTAGSVLRKARLFDEAITRRRQTEALLQITQLMSAQMSTAKVLERIIEASYSLVNCERITVFDVNAEERKIVCTLSKDESFVGVTIPWGAGVVGHVALSRKSLNITDAYADPRFDSKQDIKTGYLTRSVLTIPVCDSLGTCVVVLQAINKIGATKFSSEDVSILENMGLSAGIILAKAKLYDDALFAERKSRALIALIRAGSRHGDPEQIISGICQVAYDALRADRVTLFFVDEANDELFCLFSEDVESWTLPLGSGIAGYVGQTGEMMNIADVYKDASANFDRTFDDKTGYRTKSVLCLPIKAKDGTVLAVIQALNKRAEVAVPDVTDSNSQGGKDLRAGGVDGSGGDLLLGHDSRRNITAGDSAGVEFMPFTDEDAELLEAFAIELGHLVQKTRMDAMLEMSQKSMNQSVQSLMDEYLGNERRVVVGTPSAQVNFASRAVGGSVAEPAMTRAQSLLSGTPKLRRRHQLSSHRRRRSDSDVRGGRRGSIYDAGSHSPFVWPAPSSNKIAEMRSMDFNVFTYSADDLLGFTFDIFNDLQLLDRLQIPLQVFRNFVDGVRARYRDNPFHNWFHGFSVMHFSYLTLVKSRAMEYLNAHPVDMLALMTGALCHDIDHPGNTNAFEVVAETELAMLHNDMSVLEHHHSYTTFQLLRKPDCNILCNARADTRRMFRRLVVGAILSTDMAMHFRSITCLNERQEECPFTATDADDRAAIVNLVIHAADLSAQTLPTPIARIWEERITLEFLNQVEVEKKRGLVPTQYMQNLTDPVLRNKNQVNFIDSLLVPWWRVVCRLLPNMGECLDQLMVNRNFYAKFGEGGSGGDAALANDDKKIVGTAPSNLFVVGEEEQKKVLEEKQEDTCVAKE